MDFGASGFISKTLGIEEMREAIARVLGGGVWTPPDVDLAAGADAETAALMARLATLTPQQVRVLMMLSEGLLNKQIAYELSVSEATVKAHVSAILQKLGVESRTQAVIAAAKIEIGQWPQTARHDYRRLETGSPPPLPGDPYFWQSWAFHRFALLGGPFLRGLRLGRLSSLTARLFRLALRPRSALFAD